MTAASATRRFAAVQSLVARLPGLVHRLADWWLRQWLDMFPQRVAEFLAGRGKTMLAINVAGETPIFELLGDGLETIASARSSGCENIMENVDALLRARGLDPKTLEVGISLPAGRIFSRQLLLPAVAAPALETIVAQDMVRKTPFKPDDVLTDHVIADRPEGKLKVLQWVARRDDVQSALALLKMPFEQLAFVTCEATSGAARPIIRLHRGSRAGRSLLRHAAVALGCTALLLAGTAGGLRYWNQQLALDRLQGEIAATNDKARQIRGLVDRVRQRQTALFNLRTQKSEGPRLIAIWDEVTRVLPSHTWLAEFRIAELAAHETQVTLSGLSGAAPSLVRIIDRSRMFMDAALTAPVALDPAEGSERFVLQAKVRHPDPVKGEAR